MLIIYRIVLPVCIQSFDNASRKFYPERYLLEVGEFLPFSVLEPFFASKWKCDSHFLLHHYPEAAALVEDLLHDNHP
jgi:hypothetical protein